MKTIGYTLILLCLYSSVYAQNTSHIPPGGVYPIHEQLSFDQNPTFTWTPGQIVSADLQGSHKTFYTITMVEVLEGQTPEMAIQRNFPIFRENTQSNLLLYPAHAKNLKPATTYAWQVVMSTTTFAKNESVLPVQIQSRVNSFIHASTIEYDSLATLGTSKNTQPIYLLTQPQMNFEILAAPDKLYNVDFKITDAQGLSVISEEIIPLKDCLNNTYYIDLTDYQFFKKKKSKNRVLKLEAESADGKIFSVPFIYQ